jgi:hypothetical protein
MQILVQNPEPSASFRRRSTSYGGWMTSKLKWNRFFFYDRIGRRRERRRRKGWYGRYEEIKAGDCPNPAAHR